MKKIFIVLTSFLALFLIGNSNAFAASNVPGEDFTKKELSKLYEAGYTDEFISVSSVEDLNAFLTDGIGNVSISKSGGNFSDTKEGDNGQISTLSFNNGDDILVYVSGYKVTSDKAGYKKLRLQATYSWLNMPLNRWVDKISLAWTDSAIAYTTLSTSGKSYMTHGVFNHNRVEGGTFLETTETTSYYDDYLPKAGLTYNVDILANSLYDDGGISQYVYLPSTSSGTLQVKASYAHSILSVEPSVSAGAEGFSFGFTPKAGVEILSNAPVASVAY